MLSAQHFQYFLNLLSSVEQEIALDKEEYKTSHVAVLKTYGTLNK